MPRIRGSESFNCAVRRCICIPADYMNPTVRGVPRLYGESGPRSGSRGTLSTSRVVVRWRFMRRECTSAQILRFARESPRERRVSSARGLSMRCTREGTLGKGKLRRIVSINIRSRLTETRVALLSHFLNTSLEKDGESAKASLTLLRLDVRTTTLEHFSSCFMCLGGGRN